VETFGVLALIQFTFLAVKELEAVYIGGFEVNGHGRSP
jgi:hypothetical protein